MEARQLSDADLAYRLRTGTPAVMGRLQGGKLLLDLRTVFAEQEEALAECVRRGIAFVPFCPLGLPRGAANPVLTSPVVIQTAARLGVTAPQVALQWLLQLAPNVLLIPGTGSVAHLRENLAAEYVTLDDRALRELTAVAA